MNTQFTAPLAATRPASKTLFVTLMTAFLVAFGLSFSAQAGEVFVKRSWDHAVNGYDVVAYHTDATARKGSENFKTTYLGETWLFSSQENLDLFTANPDAYRPQYGGHCAWAMAQGNGKIAAGDPQAWHITNGKLYLNVSKGIQKRWLKKRDEFIGKADTNWPNVRSSKLSGS